MTKEQCNRRGQCIMCLMPKEDDNGVRENKNFCSYCFREGRVCFEGGKEEFIEMCKTQMRKQGISKIKSSFFAWTINFAPWWKKGFDRESALKGE